VHETLRAGDDQILQDGRALPLSDTSGAYPEKGGFKKTFLGRSGLGLRNLQSIHFSSKRMMLAYRDHLKNVRNLSFTVFEGAARIIVSLLILVILATLAWAVFKVLSELSYVFTKDIPDALKVIMIDSLTILALLEVFKTSLTYFSEGRVKVTYIIDTVLVVILTEVMAFWFKEIEYSKILMMIALVLSLIVARILAIRFSPARYAEDI
jgi:uncharacterized membrane protein (DUF373 family)